ncbi:hypothetical protein TorRG33x02_167630 [Trema orientale]|uniref:Uncharacterized protein n=1 Tax=Trema orientale TaxID=63057 RepID=A0A2P5EPD6_TREOI|nr:hypothetical protein TorRG33x02_167630 [Trema orientale]
MYSPSSYKWDRLFGRDDEISKYWSLKTEGFWVRSLRRSVEKGLARGSPGDMKPNEVVLWKVKTKSEISLTAN